MKRNKISFGLFLEVLLFVLLILIRHWKNYGETALTYKLFYAAIFAVNIVLFISLVRVKRWTGSEIFGFIVFILLAAETSLGLFALANIYIDYIMALLVLLMLVINMAVGPSKRKKTAKRAKKKSVKKKSAKKAEKPKNSDKAKKKPMKKSSSRKKK